MRRLQHATILFKSSYYMPCSGDRSKLLTGRVRRSHFLRTDNRHRWSFPTKGSPPPQSGNWPSQVGSWPLQANDFAGGQSTVTSGQAGNWALQVGNRMPQVGKRGRLTSPRVGGQAIIADLTSPWVTCQATVVGLILPRIGEGDRCEQPNRLCLADANGTLTICDLLLLFLVFS